MLFYFTVFRVFSHWFCVISPSHLSANQTCLLVRVCRRELWIGLSSGFTCLGSCLEVGMGMLENVDKRFGSSFT